MTAARTYAIGLPVSITVHDDGRVTFDIDTAEASAAPGEYDPATTEMFDEHGNPFVPDQAVRDADAARIEAAARSGR